MKTISFDKEFQEIEVTIDGQVELCDVFVSGEAEVFHDKNYGADRDGNRGISVYSVENVDFFQISAIRFDEDGNQIGILPIEFSQIAEKDQAKMNDYLETTLRERAHEY